MKKPIFSFLFVVALSSFFANIAFAGDPIPGVNVGAGKPPGGIIATKTTDPDGKFNFTIPAQGNYYLKISYTEIAEKISVLIKNKGTNINDYEFILTLDSNSPGLLVNGVAKHEIKITSAWLASNPKFNVTQAGTIMGGKLTYQRKGG